MLAPGVCIYLLSDLKKIVFFSVRHYFKGSIHKVFSWKQQAIHSKVFFCRNAQSTLRTMGSPKAPFLGKGQTATRSGHTNRVAYRGYGSEDAKANRASGCPLVAPPLVARFAASVRQLAVRAVAPLPTAGRDRGPGVGHYLRAKPGPAANSCHCEAS